MSVYVAMLRAIGPVTHRQMSMADLRAGCAAAGFTDVTTYVNTGNLVFSAAGTAASVRRAVESIVAGHGLAGLCDVFVRTPRQLAAVVSQNPFPDATAERPQRVGVCFFQRVPDWPAWVANPAGPERIAALGSVLVVDYGPGEAASRLQIERDTRARMTQRNWNTVVALTERSLRLGRTA